jgi:hypothetical protein
MMTMLHLNGLQNGELSNYAMRRQIYSAKSAQSEKGFFDAAESAAGSELFGTSNCLLLDALFEAGFRLPEDKK